MAHAGNRDAGRRTRRWRRLRGNRRGVVSVVGSLLSLLVFFALFGLFLTQYVPIWMSDNEAAFTSQAQQSMAELKSNIDLQAALGAPPVQAAAFQVSSQGIPLFAQPTVGQLAFLPKTAGVYANVTVTPGPSGQKTFYQNLSQLGTLRFSLPNRYYSAQTFELEDDAVVQSQGYAQQTLAYPPLLSVNSSGTFSAVTLALVQMYGNSSSVASQGTVDVFTHFSSRQSVTSSAASVSATFTLGTFYPCAWYRFLNAALVNSTLPAGGWSWVSPAPPTTAQTACGPTGNHALRLQIQFANLRSFTLIVAGVNVVMGQGVE
jgi:hypothetical protein